MKFMNNSLFYKDLPFINLIIRSKVSGKPAMGVHIMIKPFHKIFDFQNKIKWTSAIGLVFYHVFGAYWCWLYAFPFKLLTPIFGMFFLVFIFSVILIAFSDQSIRTMDIFARLWFFSEKQGSVLFRCKWLSLTRAFVFNLIL